MDLASLGFPGFLVLVVALFFASTFVSARTMRREVRHALARKQEIPAIVRWWPRVVARAGAILGAGIALVAAGVGALLLGAVTAGQVLVLLGVGALCYVAHARILVAVARRAGA